MRICEDALTDWQCSDVDCDQDSDPYTPEGSKPIISDTEIRYIFNLIKNYLGGIKY
jgi:hypothetical protein